jgi:hypothetical protein
MHSGNEQDTVRWSGLTGGKFLDLEKLGHQLMLRFDVLCNGDV